MVLLANPAVITERFPDGISALRPKGGATMALRFASGANKKDLTAGVDTATSPNVNITYSSSRNVTSMDFQFDWYVAKGGHSDNDVCLQFSGNGGNTWNTVWSSSILPGENKWRTVVIAGGIPDSNSYWDGSDFRFRFTVSKNPGSTQTDIRIDNIQILASTSGLSFPSIWTAPEWVKGKFSQQPVVFFNKTQEAVHTSLQPSISKPTGAPNVDMTAVCNKKVWQQQNKRYEGFNSISINNLGHLQAGIYVLQLVVGGETTNINKASPDRMDLKKLS
jgi:hypothetical protein